MKKQLLLLSVLFVTLGIFAQSQLNFDGYQDHVEFNGTDFSPSWTAEV